MNRISPAPGFRETLKFWWRLGFISFGGPAGQIAIMHEFLVERKAWVSEEKFLHALNYCMLLPGPEAQQLATYLGWLLHGKRGGLAAGILFVLPSALILWGLSVIYVCYGNLSILQSAFVFLKPAVLAMVLVAILKIGQKSLISTIHFLVAGAAFVLLYFFKAPFPVIILGAILAGLLSYWNKSGLRSNLSFGTQAQLSGAGRGVFLQITAAVVLWLMPLAILYCFLPDFEFWQHLTLFFTKAAFVTFGGAYAVLPYVAQVSVEQFGWLSRPEMLDGLALGETTPGPLIMVLAFIGFMAGYHHFGASIGMASVGLATTVWYTFLPSFLFIFIGAPWIERSQSNNQIKDILQYTSPAITGVIASLCVYLGKAVFLSTAGDIQWVAITWTAVSLLALHKFKVNILIWIGISVALGICTGMFFSGLRH